MSLNQLFYNTTALSTTDFTFRFHCPICGTVQSLRYWFDKTVAVPQQPAIDVNALVATIIPAHNDAATGLPCAGGGQQIQLHVALHKDPTHPLNGFISPSAIAANWWQRLPL